MHRAPHTDDPAEALARLDALRAAGAMKAALLALLIQPAQPARLRLWRDETDGIADADQVLADVDLLDERVRVPLYERLLARQASLPLAERQALLRAAREVMRAPVVPLDRLRWLAMRRAFGERPPTLTLSTSPWDVEAPASQLSVSEMMPVVQVTAHLARIVPGETDAGQDWYRAVLGHWLREDEIPPWKRPDIDALVCAVGALQTMSWRLRPQVVRQWVTTALKRPLPGPDRDALDALRLACGLLDCPMPPDLARRFDELPTA